MKQTISNFLVGLLVIIIFNTHAYGAIKSVHCPIECPSNPENNTLIFRHIYALSNNPVTKFADWVAYEINVSNFGDSPGRKWKAERLLEQNSTLENSDYRDANQTNYAYDRGHQAPLASFAGSRYWMEANYLSNATPQRSDLNRWAWKDLESAIRASVSYGNSIFVITGPLYNEKTLLLPRADEPHKIPWAYFKVIYNAKGDSASFLMKQTIKKTVDFCNTQITLVDLLSKLQFKLPKLQDNYLILNKLGCSKTRQ